MKVLTVVGARPQFIKAAPVSSAIAACGLDEVLVHTGQHFDTSMSDVFFDELGLRVPQHNLHVSGGLHGDQTGRMLIALEPVVVSEQPDVLLVYGDTNSTLAGVLVASKLHVPVAHVEAGLRSFDRTMPEEVNRVVADHLSDVLFAPTDVAVSNLAAEGITKGVVLSGDVMYDAALMFADRGSERDGDAPYVLVTIHRASATDDAETLQSVLDALQAVRASGLDVVWPMHPRTAGRIEEFGMQRLLAGLDVRGAMSYVEMTGYTRRAAVVLTDSGGLQKEAFFHRVPCVTARTSTEWTELVDLEWNRLVDPSDASAIVRAVTDSIGTTGADGQPYGDGHAAERIAETLAMAGSRA